MEIQRSVTQVCGCLLCYIFVSLSSVDTVSIELPGTDNDVYLVPGMYHGFSNQRMCLSNAIATAIKKRWTFVLPDVRFNYPNVETVFTEPFEFFFDVSTFQTLSISGLSIAPTLPTSKVRACLWQLSHKFEGAIYPSLDTLDAWAHMHHVVCLHDQRTIDTIWQHQFMDDSLKKNIRKALRPAAQFQEEVQAVSSKMLDIMGTSDYVGLHARIEDDWIQYCQRPEFKEIACYIGEEGLLEHLKSEVGIEPGSPVYLASGAEIGKLPQLCSTYKCYSRDDFWASTTSSIAHAHELLVKAYMDFLIIQGAAYFIGNRLSTFSMELFHIFRDANKGASFVNELQCPPGQRISFGCQPAYILSCCIALNSTRPRKRVHRRHLVNVSQVKRDNA